MTSKQPESNFKKLHKFREPHTGALYTQYESQRTGLRVVAVEQKGPIVYGQFVVATEIHDDSGARECSSLYLLGIQ
jgi:Zn-dependent M16 (insulinase) family peptidase